MILRSFRKRKSQTEACPDHQERPHESDSFWLFVVPSHASPFELAPKIWKPLLIRPSIEGEGLNMKVFARKEPQALTFLELPLNAATSFNTQPTETRLRVIQPQPRWPRLSPSEIKRKLASVSQIDVMRVHWATIREGQSHCIWPMDVLEKLSTADVITEKSTPHYVLREDNLTRVK
jgi:hypothetical protein